MSRACETFGASAFHDTIVTLYDRVSVLRSSIQVNDTFPVSFPLFEQLTEITWMAQTGFFECVSLLQTVSDPGTLKGYHFR